MEVHNNGMFLALKGRLLSASIDKDKDVLET